MVLLIISLSVVAGAELYAQSSKDLSNLIRRGEVYLDPDTREVYSGQVFAMFPEGLISEQGTLQDGRKDGRYKYLYLKNSESTFNLHVLSLSLCS